MSRSPRLGLALAAAVLAGVYGPGSAAAQSQGQITYAMHVTIAAAWFDPAENTGIATPFMVPLYMLSFHNGVGPRVQEPSLGRIPLHYYTAPFEDIRLKDR
jgi:hypothetical protein